ncbi:hypothetical protein [Actinomadura oligospora]|uniref:hypothetical protein n=1 Tax=Actinomadura oligospora TaxID=111804 RepID=UPI000479D035|nr:hypothetical protein [Actinomadura oligospora]
MLRPIAVTALILALATACGGGDGDDSGTDRAAGTAPAPSSGTPGAAGSLGPAGSPSAAGTPGGPGGPGSTASPDAAGSPNASGGPVTINGVTPGRAAPSKLDGTWTSGQVKLFFYRGAAALNSPNFCTGSITPQNAITLTCADRSTQRTQGTAELSGSSLKVTWTGGTVDTLTRKS